jgi:hypothetical protein
MPPAALAADGRIGVFGVSSLAAVDVAAATPQRAHVAT